ncbi:hypothetical protein [Streptomyces genisteinicus]|uniref:hypothetical protein n=1 Tax=Streptomyces genisteinicus TaxID=2768068 RepID=UPI001FEAB90D|nr:hypothetical protein [Streptomyces genisteinicus]
MRRDARGRCVSSGTALRTCRIRIRSCTVRCSHGYTGPIDGAMGPHSWRGFARFLNQDRWD